MPSKAERKTKSVFVDFIFDLKSVNFSSHDFPHISMERFLSGLFGREGRSVQMSSIGLEYSLVRFRSSFVSWDWRAL